MYERSKGCSTAKLTATLAALVFATTALAGCTATTAPQTAGPSQKSAASHAPEPSATPASAETDDNDCTNPAWINLGSMSASLTGDLVDRGAREFAEGDVVLNDEGNIVSYTVAPGDVASVVGERLCIKNAISLATLNHTGTIHPGQVLRLNVDPDVPWVPYYNPHDAPAGFQQIPYQGAIEAMASAADADDFDSMRAIWTDELSGMFANPADIDLIEQALETGDPDVLRQMFS